MQPLRFVATQRSPLRLRPRVETREPRELRNRISRRRYSAVRRHRQNMIVIFVISLPLPVRRSLGASVVTPVIQLSFGALLFG